MNEPSVLYLDNHLLVIGKPAGFLSQGDHSGDDDVISWSKNYLKKAFSKPGNVYAGLVHRLDRPVSGVMVVARTSKAASRLTAQWKNRTPVKRYLAIVEGHLDSPGEMKDCIAKRDQKVKVVSPSHPAGKKALLSFNPVWSKNGMTAVDISLKTGRPHQIRVQFSSRGFPLLGDFRYGATRRFDGKNLALHSYSLTFEHPVKKEEMNFTWGSPLQVWSKLLPGFKGQAHLKQTVIHLHPEPNQFEWNGCEFQDR
ncbi:MAG: RNA pseudouridine synthase [Acidobacteria bacterium]|nr:MAG: RNA pseudouridine synthase [Acidobacteriota bacterium]